MAEIKIDRERCKGCELCIHFCPRNCIVKDEVYNKKGHHPTKFVNEGECSGCALCAKICPDIAIEVWR